VTVELPLVQLLRDIITRWDTVYYMVRRLHEMHPAIEHFLAMPVNRDLAKHRMTDMEWSVLLDVQVVLEIPHAVQQTMLSDTNLVLTGSISAFEIFMTSWERLAERHPRLKGWIDVGLGWANQYYSQMDLTKAYVITMGK
ncbi:hypothetical protein PILCRDRAFT_80649, partial [Piloderma croceum F 1598]